MGGIARSIGAIATTAIGGALGGPLGAAITNTLFNLLVPPAAQQPSTGLSDLLREGAKYGTPIRVIFGTMPIKGDVIDVGYDKHGRPAGIEVVEKNAKGGGTGGTPSSGKTEKNFLTAAYLLGEGPLIVDRMTQHDDDGDTVKYDRYGSTDRERGIDMTSEYGAVSGAVVAELSERVNFYRGTEEQSRDTRLQQIHGSKTVPYRGCAYVMFNHYKLSSNTSFTFLCRNPIDDSRTIIEKRFAAASIPSTRVALSALTGNVEGCAIAQVEPARELCEKIAAVALCDLMFINGAFRAVSRQNPTWWDIADGDLGAHLVSGQSGGGWPSKTGIEIKSEIELPTTLTIRFVDPNSNYETNEAVATRQTASHEKHESIELPFAARMENMVTLADRTLDELWAAQGGETLSLPPKYSGIAPGNVVVYRDESGPRAVRIIEQQTAPEGVLSLKGVPYDAGVYGIHRIVTLPPIPPPQVPVYVAPTFFAADMMPLERAMMDAPGVLLGVAVPSNTPWQGAVFLSDEVSGFGAAELPVQATLGTLQTAYAYTDSDLGRYDNATTLRVTLLRGALVSADARDCDTLGANLLAVATGDGALLLSFATATPVGDGAFDLSGIRPGRYGSDFIKSVPSGARIMLLADHDGSQADGVLWKKLPPQVIGNARTFEMVSASDTTISSGAQTLTVSGNTLKPLRARGAWKSSDGAGGWALHFFAGTRDIEGERAYWLTGLAPQQPDPRRFTVTLANGVGTILDTRTFDAPDGVVTVEYSQAQLTAMFAGAPYTVLRGSIVQEGKYLRGHEYEFEV